MGNLTVPWNWTGESPNGEVRHSAGKTECYQKQKDL